MIVEPIRPYRLVPVEQVRPGVHLADGSLVELVELRMEGGASVRLSPRPGRKRRWSISGAPGELVPVAASEDEITEIRETLAALAEFSGRGVHLGNVILPVTLIDSDCEDATMEETPDLLETP